ncbi:fumarylacetoacetate hydrolase family protein [Candidatus Berkiella cookevillensis]|uniref:Fumarylacetoacetate hydrolase family protein n=1 Tax=Candidatus Berkiella cookevillensis TaxID=437022 RepID=A0A0Q9YKJ3_9GAMM|nr:fumarylacetoacetate hydrolase family protein [Candidatus Berkiella cookevillensis]MCS5708000.1 fumarylacetoacetate hydrolase family protein [Candidatus Berkiella cookevillensis]
MSNIPYKSVSYVIDPPPRAELHVKGSEQLFPVNRVFCIGRNYAAHAVEMGHDPDREPPFFFCKNLDNITSDGIFPYPAETNSVDYEIELIVALGKGGTKISEVDALSYVWGYGVGLDMTRRDLQAEAKKLGRPWEVAKSFDKSAPCSSVVSASIIGHPTSGAITLDVNGHRHQEGDLNQMIWKVPEIIAVLSRYLELQPGDIIMTGTPAGVGKIVKGDLMEGNIDGIGSLSVRVT